MHTSRLISPRIATLLLILCACLTTACTTTRPGANETDVLEAYNRPMHAVNVVVDDYLVYPASEVYRFVTPEPARTGVSNALANLNEPLTFVHCLLQGNPLDALETLGRFALNSTVGLGGLLQVTPEEGTRRPSRDFGQTLGRWGLSGGAYLVLPLFGPSSVRDAVGSAGDALALEPVAAIQRHNDWDEAATARGGLGVLSGRAGVTDRAQRTGEPPPQEYEVVRDRHLRKRLEKVRRAEEVDADDEAE